MRRRSFVKAFMNAIAGVSLGDRVFAGVDNPRKRLVCINMTGGWDVSSFCDPKINITGEPLINTWAKTRGILREGNLEFADYGNNAQFFSKYWKDILIVNGIDSQTNSHGAAARASFTGSLREGLPSLTSLYALEWGRDLALPHLTLGSGVAFSSAGLIPPIRITNSRSLKSLTNANSYIGSNDPIQPEEVYRRTLALKRESIEKKIQRKFGSDNNYNLRKSYSLALSNLDGLEALENISIPMASPAGSFGEQVEIAMMALLSGQTSSVDLGPIYSRSGGSFSFDTHTAHDADHEVYLSDALSGIDYLWTLAEELGLADSLIVVVSSDFGRTPYYNSDGGKDHWPIGSTMIMEKNKNYTNRVIGLTDELQYAQRINPITLSPDNFGGIYINTSHVQDALRDYLDLSQASSSFPLQISEKLNLFSI